MLVRGSRVGIIGGSIAGCATAIALERLGCDVQVFERSSSVLRDRGSGIAIPIPLRDELIDAGYLPAGYAPCLVSHRWWILADATSSGRLLWTQPAPAAHNNWGVLWRSLRAGVDDAKYHGGATLREFSQDAEGVTAVFDHGTTQRFDLLVGADGYRSMIRQQVLPRRERSMRATSCGGVTTPSPGFNIGKQSTVEPRPTPGTTSASIAVTASSIRSPTSTAAPTPASVE